MRGWIGLRKFLDTQTPHGLDLVVLQSICDRLRLNKTVVHACLVRFGNPNKMVLTTLSDTYQLAHDQNLTHVEALELIQETFRKLRAMATRLRPGSATDFADMQSVIVSRLSEFLDFVISPLLTELRGGVPQPTGLTEQADKNLQYMFKRMKEERQVPLIRYGITPEQHSASTTLSYMNNTAPPAPLIDEATGDTQYEMEQNFSLASLKSENSFLRARVLQLEIDKQKLDIFNEQLEFENQKLHMTNKKL
jgi:hypothetical protein